MVSDALWSLTPPRKVPASPATTDYRPGFPLAHSYRYLDFMTEHLKQVCNYELQPELRGELETAILHLEVSEGVRERLT
jgi:hypothetical protein